jgi:hypothetical protein
VRSPKNLLIVLLTLTTVGGAALAWHQYQELVELRASALDKNERADWQKRLWDLEKSNRELSDRLAALRAEHGDMDGLVADANAEQPPRERGNRGGPDRGNRGGRGPNFGAQTAVRELLAKPEVQAMIEQQRKLAIEDRYGALFKNLNLNPAQAEKLKTLLADRQNSAQDVLAVAREQGIDPRSDPEGFRKLVADARNDINNNIKSLVGDAGFEQLQSYEQTMPQRNLVDQLQRRLSYTGNEMSPAQAEQLVGILAATAPQRPTTDANGAQTGRGPGGFAGRGDLGALAGAYFGAPGLGAMMEGGRGGAVAVTPEAVTQAQGVLSQAQLAALQQVQQQQQQAQQLRQMVNETLSNSATQSGQTKSAPTNGPRRRGGGG